LDDDFEQYCGDGVENIFVPFLMADLQGQFNGFCGSITEDSREIVSRFV
jgi:hypothetical protein